MVHIVESYSKYKILIVDDEQNILKALKRALRPLTCEVVLANNGADALARLASDTYVLMLTDMRMPVMNGPELLRRVAEDYPHCRRLVLTGFADLDQTLSAINEGKIHRFFTKPWDNDHLLEAVQEELEIYQQKEAEAEAYSELGNSNQTLSSKVGITASVLEHSADLMKASRYQSALDIQKKLLGRRFPHLLRLSDKVASTSAMLAKAMGLTVTEIDTIRTAAQLHRLGLMAIPHSIAAKPVGRMTKDERRSWEQYPILGEDAVKGNALSDEVATLIRHHREHYNGGGFPDRLVGQYIPIGARIIGLAADFHELAESHGEELAIRFVQSQKNRRYDPMLVDQLLTIEQPDSAAFT